jgi:hypothetical protein
MLQIPSYIDTSGMRGVPIKHKWTSTDPIDRDNPKMWAALGKTSLRSMLLLAAGSAEWVAWRFDGLGDVQDNQRYVEAVFAGVIHPAYTIPWQWPKDGDPEGHVDAPLAECNRMLTRTYLNYNRLSLSAAQTCARVAQLAQHVIPKKKAFEDWFQESLKRLTKLHPQSKNDPLGPLVSCEALNPDFKYTPAQANDLVRDFLGKLEPKTNPYLRPAAAMTKEGFKGKPYTL